MRKVLLLIIAVCTLTFTGCNEQTKKETATNIAEDSIANIKVVSPQEVYDALQNEQALQILDVRTPAEYGVTHLKSSQNICLMTPGFEEKAAKLDKSLPIYVYCKKGGRSAKASQILAAMGFTEIYDLQGGITNWEDQELEVVKG